MRVWALMILLLSGLPVFGQQDQSMTPLNNAEARQRTEAQLRRVRAQFEEIRAQSDKEERKLLESIEQTNPELYQQLEEQRQERKRIQQVIKDYRAGRLDEQTARDRLRPDVKQQMQGYLQNLDKTIAAEERRLAELRRQKNDPDRVVEQRISAMLGKGQDPTLIANPMMPNPPRATAPTDQQQ